MAEAFPSSSKIPSPEEAANSRLTMAEDFKKQGNELYKDKTYKKAVGKYHRALLQVKDISRKDAGQMMQGIMGMVGGGGETKAERSLPEELTDRATQLEMSCYNNLAACLLHDTDPNYAKIIQYCENVLKCDAKNTKAMYRKGVALYHRKDYDEAKACFNRALSYSEKDPEILRYLRLCDEAMVKQREMEKQRYQGVFRKMAEEDMNG